MFKPAKKHRLWSSFLCRNRCQRTLNCFSRRLTVSCLARILSKPNPWTGKCFDALIITVSIICHKKFILIDFFLQLFHKDLLIAVTTRIGTINTYNWTSKKGNSDTASESNPYEIVGVPHITKHSSLMNSEVCDI